MSNDNTTTIEPQRPAPVRSSDLFGDERPTKCSKCRKAMRLWALEWAKNRHPWSEQQIILATAIMWRNGPCFCDHLPNENIRKNPPGQWP